jgi:SAM-dependent methyltransferase
MEDLRKEVACYYDVSFDLDDTDFYSHHISSDGNSRVLELGCGTGRVLIPLSRKCASIVGVDKSQGMIDICREKLKRSSISQHRAKVIHGDISRLELKTKFDLIIAPFRVFQNLEYDEEVDKVFSVIWNHLGSSGFCILNVFNPNAPREQLISTWTASSKSEEILSFEKPFGNGILRNYYRRKRIRQKPLIIYPELIYRYYENDELVNEVSFEAPMRVYYPEEFRKIVTDHDFIIVENWGGYAGEKYGQGSELVSKFRGTPAKRKGGTK